MDVFWAIPNDYESISDGIDHGTPAVVKSHRCKAARSIRDLAGSLAERAARESATDTPGKPAVEPQAEHSPAPAVENVERKHMRPAVPQRRQAASSGSSMSVKVDLPGF
jgi:hypothetical protein